MSLCPYAKLRVSLSGFSTASDPGSPTTTGELFNISALDPLLPTLLIATLCFCVLLTILYYSLIIAWEVFWATRRSPSPLDPSAEVVLTGMALQWTKFATFPIPQVSTDSSKSGVGPCKLRIDETTVLSVTVYTHRQANIYHRMIHVFLDDWYPILNTLSLGSTWLSNYPRPVKNKRRHLVSNVPAHRSTLTSPSDDSATQVTPEMPTTTTTQHHD